MTDPGLHKPCFQAHHVSLSELLSMARYYGVDLKGQEYWLLAAVKAAVLAPVVEPWIQQDEAGQPVFKHTGCATFKYCFGDQLARRTAAAELFERP